MSATTLAARLCLGDRILVEPSEGESFEATVKCGLGWGITHGELLFECRRDDGTTFTYGIDYRVEVPMIEADA